ncbi:hypothetical protein PCC9214_04518 [Planktothrix tepida]|uniref:Uncharacterized protein n=2 Tax=Planktothrix TaxID=54304 RepID=A0A1J1LLY1_9CYAN|nr:hypothetical protein NO713_00929 [Planktothrix pseudagardhii]CAD5979500.1 hypothetical protein PCC9214_04518 [Planktothrix tepida]CUR33487.1 exported hypothetical protein [Planktothrix tepida PCC 9214]
MCIVLIIATIAAFIISLISALTIMQDNSWDSETHRLLLFVGFIGGIILVLTYKMILSC